MHDRELISPCSATLNNWIQIQPLLKTRPPGPGFRFIIIMFDPAPPGASRYTFLPFTPIIGFLSVSHPWILFDFDTGVVSPWWSLTFTEVCFKVKTLSYKRKNIKIHLKKLLYAKTAPTCWNIDGIGLPCQPVNY